jgi:DNA-binding MarR family transcriptional regulator
MQLVDSVTYSDHLLLYYLLEHARNPLTITHAELSAKLGIPKRTIERASQRLELAGLVKRTRSYGNVLTFEVINDDSQQSA